MRRIKCDLLTGPLIGPVGERTSLEELIEILLSYEVPFASDNPNARMFQRAIEALCDKAEEMDGDRRWLEEADDD